MNVRISGVFGQRIALFAAIIVVALFMTHGKASACACCGTYQVVNVASWDVLNIRSGPSVRYRIIGAFGPYDGCIVLTGQRRGNWVRVSGNGQTGWVNGRYLRYVR